MATVKELKEHIEGINTYLQQLSQEDAARAVKYIHDNIRIKSPNKALREHVVMALASNPAMFEIDGKSLTAPEITAIIFEQADSIIERLVYG